MSEEPKFLTNIDERTNLKFDVAKGTVLCLQANNFKSVLLIHGGEIKICMKTEKPCWFHRLMHKLFFGFEWEDYKE